MAKPRKYTDLEQSQIETDILSLLAPSPMICGLPDPLAVLAWDAVVEDTAATVRAWWNRVQATLAFTAWSIGCFLLGWLA